MYFALTFSALRFINSRSNFFYFGWRIGSLNVVLQSVVTCSYVHSGMAGSLGIILKVWDVKVLVFLENVKGTVHHCKTIQFMQQVHAYTL